MRLCNITTRRSVAALLWCGSVLIAPTVPAQVSDPGVRTAATDGGPPVPMPGLINAEQQFFMDGLNRFEEVETVSGGNNVGLGPRFNSNQCASCHAQPYVGGSSPATNPLFTVYNAAGATNQMPWFEAVSGPVREARFIQSNGVADGGVHNLFVVTGRSDVSSSCNITQPVFTRRRAIR